jgi:DNA-binding PadR family transcriptional regulator
MNKHIAKYLPLTEATAYILIALQEPLHGYGVMQKVEAISKGTVKIGPGTLYGAFTTLETEGLIVKTGEQQRRKLYALTDKGKLVLGEHLRRLELLVQNGVASLKVGKV